MPGFSVLDGILDTARDDENAAKIAEGGKLTQAGMDLFKLADDGRPVGVSEIVPSIEDPTGVADATEMASSAGGSTLEQDYASFFRKNSEMFPGMNADKFGRNMANLLEGLGENESLIRATDTEGVGIVKLGLVSRKCEFLLRLDPGDLKSLLESFENDSEKLKQFIKESQSEDFQIISQFGTSSQKGKVSLREFATYRESVRASWKNKGLLDKTNSILSKTGRGDRTNPFKLFKGTVEGDGKYGAFFEDRIDEKGINKLDNRINKCEKMKRDPNISGKKVIDTAKSEYGDFIKELGETEGEDINYENYLSDINDAELAKFDRQIKNTESILDAVKTSAKRRKALIAAIVGITGIAVGGYLYGRYELSSPNNTKTSKPALAPGNPAKPFLTCASPSPPNNPLTSYELGYICGLEQTSKNWASNDDMKFNCPSPNKNSFEIAPSEDCEKCVRNGMIEQPEIYDVFDRGEWDGNESIAENICSNITDNVDEVEEDFDSMKSKIKSYAAITAIGFIIIIILLIMLLFFVNSYIKIFLISLFYSLCSYLIYYFGGKLRSEYRSLKHTNLTANMMKIFNKYNKASDKNVISDKEIAEYISEIDNDGDNPNSSKNIGNVVDQYISFVNNDTFSIIGLEFLYVNLFILFIVAIIKIILVFRSNKTEIPSPRKIASAAKTKVKDGLGKILSKNDTPDPEEFTVKNPLATNQDSDDFEVDVTINKGGEKVKNVKQGGGGIKDISKKIKPKILNKFNRWLIIILLIFAILINHFYNKNRSGLENKNYIREIKRTQREQNKKFVIKEKEINKHNLSDTVFGGYFI